MADNRNKFVETAARALGVSPDIVYAHTVLETGREGKTVGQFNYGNIKAGKSWTGAVAHLNALEYDKAGNPVKEPSKFRVYSTPEQAGEDYARLLKTRYPGAAGAASGAAFAAALQAGGYATDHEYVQKFVKLVGGSLPAAEEQAAGYAKRPPIDRLDDPLKEIMPGKGRYARAGAGAGGDGAYVPPVIPDLGSAPRADVLSELDESKQQGQAATAKQDVSLLEMARSSAKSDGIIGAGIRKLAAATLGPDDTPDPTFRLDPKMLRGLEEDEQEWLKDSPNQAAAEFRAQQVAWRKEDQSQVQARGPGMALLAGSIASLPESMLFGYGAFRLASLAKKATLSTAFAENLGGSLAAEVVQRQIDPFWTVSDAAANVVLGTGLGTLASIPALRETGRLEARIAEAAEKQASVRVDDHAAARAKLGEDAVPEAVAEEVQRIEVRRQEARVRDLERPEFVGPEVPAALRPDDLPSVEPVAVGRSAAASADVPAVASVGESDARPFHRAQKEQRLIDRLVNSLRSLFRSTPAEGAGRPDTHSWDGWDAKDVFAIRESQFRDGKYKHLPERLSNGQYKTFADMDALRPGVHAQAGKDFSHALASVEKLRQQFLGKEFRVVLADADAGLKAEGANGAATVVKQDLAIINIDLTKPVKDQVSVIVHEVGHLVWQRHLSGLSPAERRKVDAAYQDFVRAAGREQARMRYANSNKNATVSVRDTKYEMSRDEFSAEQFVKYVEDSVLYGNNYLRLERSFVDKLAAAVMHLLAFFKQGMAGFKHADRAYTDMFNSILERQGAINSAAQIAPKQQPQLRSRSVDVTHGLNLAPAATAAERAERTFITDLYARAESPDFVVDEKRLSKLYDTALFQGAQSNANTLLRSENPVARMFAALAVESPSGAAGRRRNAAIAKALHERAFLGNTMNEVQAAYREFRQARGGGVVEDTFHGKVWEEFNVAVAAEIEARGSGSAVDSAPSVKAAADSLEAAYDRMRQAQVGAKTTGWANLPTTSTGYMPHRLSPERLRTATPEQFSVLHDALVTQFVDKGFDLTFADRLAAKYVTRAKTRAFGGAGTATGADHVGAADVVQEALEAMGMSRDEVLASMKKFMAAGPGHTKKRLDLDLNRTHILADGSEFRLRDFYETDQFALLRAQAQRVSGEVALTEHGIPGKAGLDLYRRALMYGNNRVTKEEIEAFDQIAAEFLGQPFGTQSKLVDRVTQANALARLGGMGFTQAAEWVNGVAVLGAGRVLQSVIDTPRLKAEIKALARGERVDNPIIGSLERVYGGAEFGTDSYKTVFPFDNRSLEVQSFGQETLTLMDRLLRGGAHMQGKLSLWRTLHSVQQRGMAEQIVRTAAVYLRDGKAADVYLRDMGISDELIAKLRADLPNIAEFDSSGRLAKLDLTRAADVDAAQEFTQAVWRGTNQIIQGQFIGERNAWAPQAHMRLLTQFRTFGLTAVEKQWGRQVGNVGAFKAAGIVLGAACMVLPIYAARVMVNSIGRDDADEYIEEAFAPERVGRQILNYVAGSGLVGDLLDVLGAVTGVNLGGRTGDTEQRFVGNVVAPAASLVDDVYSAVQNTDDGTDVEKLAKSSPMSKLPFVIPALNVLFAD